MSFLEMYSQDASELIRGKILYDNFTNEKDEVFECLFDVDDDNFNVLTIEALQIILLNFQLVLERQLSDCLPGGCLNENTEGVDKNLREQSKTVATTNIISERDFANLDRLQREKPNANLIALEGMILFTNNKTINWLSNLEEEKKCEYFRLARSKTPEVIRKFKERKILIQRQHQLLLKKREDEKLYKHLMKQKEVEKISKDIQLIGGLWQNCNDINNNLLMLSTQNEKN